MVRTEDDSWDIAGAVGTTALATAMVRAAETVRADGLFADPYAQHFLDAAEARGWKNPYTTGAWHRTTTTTRPSGGSGRRPLTGRSAAPGSSTISSRPETNARS